MLVERRFVPNSGEFGYKQSLTASAPQLDDSLVTAPRLRIGYFETRRERVAEVARDLEGCAFCRAGGAAKRALQEKLKASVAGVLGAHFLTPLF